ncbi:hypothetical protein ASU35_16585 [Acetivibrio ethanolgignens]|uniref:Uncharacterized protein n=1 Tax=Acetivibrio ethanolgignens TaxID=290052 RepID=A0A0V8QA07_9FIRM|nr:hypothetical protein ASU35_16585 [Acetivibrio ethanolgignens]
MAAFKAEETWNLVKNLLIDFVICLSFWVACVILCIHSMSLRKYDCFLTSKILRVIYTILKTGTTYDPQKLLKDIKHPVSAQAALAS